MRVIFNCHWPFPLTQGDAQLQIEQIKAALEKLGVTVEPLPWWKESQSGEVLHHLGRISSPTPPMPHIRKA